MKCVYFLTVFTVKGLSVRWCMWDGLLRFTSEWDLHAGVSSHIIFCVVWMSSHLCGFSWGPKWLMNRKSWMGHYVRVSNHSHIQANKIQGNKTVLMTHNEGSLEGEESKERKDEEGQCAPLCTPTHSIVEDTLTLYPHLPRCFLSCPSSCPFPPLHLHLTAVMGRQPLL